MLKVASLTPNSSPARLTIIGDDLSIQQKPQNLQDCGHKHDALLDTCRGTRDSSYFSPDCLSEQEMEVKGIFLFPGRASWRVPSKVWG